MAFPSLGHSNIIAAFSNRLSGNMSFSYGDTGNVALHRKEFLGRIGIDYRSLVCARQIHSKQVEYVSSEKRGRGALSHDAAIADTDAFITDQSQVPLAVFTADCLSIFLYDPGVPSVGIVHAGWRGTKEGIVTAVIRKMQGLFGIDTGCLQVSFGPAIRQCCYEVGEEFEGFFPDEVISRNGKYYFDIVEANKRQLCAAGVKGEHMFDTHFCTSCQPEIFFSYRREGKGCGRMMSVVMLR